MPTSAQNQTVSGLGPTLDTETSCSPTLVTFRTVGVSHTMTG